MPASGDFQKSRDLQAFFAGVSRDGIGATRAAMRATEEATADCFANEADPLGNKWAALAPSTLKRREPGVPILRGLQPDLIWQLLGVGRWRLHSRLKDYAVYHLGKDYRTGRPARPFQPVQPGAILAFGARIHDGLTRWLDDHRRRVGL